MAVVLASATTTKAALEAWKQKTQQNPATATNISLEYQTPPIVKIGPSVKKLAKCEILNLACNMIEKPTLYSTLKNLRVLNLSRNNLRSLDGIELVSRSLEELWVSYNLIYDLKPVESLKKLKIFYASHNNIRDWSELRRLGNLPCLTEISFYGNPLQESMSEERFRREAIRRLPNIVKLDFVPVIRLESLKEMKV